MKKLLCILISVLMCFFTIAAGTANSGAAMAAETSHENEIDKTADINTEGESSEDSAEGESNSESNSESNGESEGESDGESAGESAGESDGESTGDSAGGTIPSGGSFGDVKTGVINNSVIIVDPNGVTFDENAADLFEIASGSAGITKNAVSGLHLENDSIYNNRNDGDNSQGITGLTFLDVSAELGGNDRYYSVKESEDPLERPLVTEGDEYNTVIILDDEDEVFSRQGNEIADGAAVAFGGGTSDDMIVVDHVFLWTKGFKRTNLFADDNAEQLVVRNSRFVSPGAENYKLGWQALYGGARATLLQNGDCWFYNDQIVTEGWGALSIDSSPNLDLYAVNCELSVLGGGYITYTPGDGTINYYGVKADSAQYGIFVTGNSSAYIHSMDDLDAAALTWYTDEDAEAENVTEDGRTTVNADYAAILTHQIMTNSPTVEGHVYVENSVLSTDNVYTMADNSHFLNDTYGGTTWFWTEMWRGSTCLCRSSNATYEFDHADLISRTNVIFRTVVNWEGPDKDYSIPAETQAVGNRLIMRNMDVTGDVRNDDIYRNLYVDMTDTALTGAFVSTTVKDWNDMFRPDTLKASDACAAAEEMIAAWKNGEIPNATYDAEYPYAEAILDLDQVSANMTLADNGVINGIHLVMNEGSTWTVTGDSRLISLHVAEDAVINAEGYQIYVNCDGFDISKGESLDALDAGDYENVVIIREDDPDSKDADETDGKTAGDEDGKAAGDPETVSEGNIMEGKAEEDFEGDSEGDFEGESEGDSEGDSNGAENGNSEGGPESESEGDFEGDSEGESNGAENGNSEGGPEGDSEGESVGDSGESESGEADNIDVDVQHYSDGTIIALKNARLLDKNHNCEELDVLVRDGAIIEVGEDLEGDETVDLTGYTLMPGMIDSHVHIAGSSGYNLELLKQFSTQGITSVREEGMLSTLNEEDYISLIQEANMDPASAFLVSCGKYFDEEGGYGMGPTGNMGIIITNPEEAVKEVNHKAELGFSQVKVGINSDTIRMTGAEFSAVIDAAHSQEMFVSAHINYSAYLEELAEYGIDESAHTPQDEMNNELISYMVANEIAMNTSGAENDREIKADNLKRFYEAGGYITVGTDKMRGYDTCMKSLIEQMTILAQAGLSIQEIITCATSNNAMALGINTGLIAEGYEADLIAVQGEVDQTFEALLDIDFIMNDGSEISLRD